MKTALMFVLVAIGGVTLSVRAATAQQPMPPSGPAYATVPQPAPVGPQPTPANGPLPAPGTPVQNPAGSPGVDTSLLIDNGLWDNAAVPACCAICGGGCCAPPDWYTEQDVRIFNRSRPRDVGIGFEFPTPQVNSVGTELLNSRTASPDISAIWGMTLGHYFARDTENRDHFIEFTFWGLNNWRDEASANGHRVSILNSTGEKTSEQGDLYSGYAVSSVLNTTTNEEVPVLNGTYVPGFDKADLQTTYYSSSTNNFEINGRISPRNGEDRLVLHPNGKWRRECQPGLYMSYLYGLRFMQINETFRFHSESRIDTYDPASGILIDSREDTGDYGIVTHNNLLGFQVGAEMTWRQCRWSWGLCSKIGPCVNFADQVSNISSLSSDPTIDPFMRRLSYSKHNGALIAEAGIQATYKFRPNLMGRAMYDITWVPGVALAPEQLQFNTEPINKINTNGLAYFQGVTLGLEWLW
ncbi:MAG: hypothetical protein WCB27_03950 [Thermoguttaceae bacterium]